MSCVMSSIATTFDLMILAGCTTISSTSGSSIAQSSTSVVWQASTVWPGAEGALISVPPVATTLPESTRQRHVPQRPDMQLYEMGT